MGARPLELSPYSHRALVTSVSAHTTPKSNGRLLVLTSAYLQAKAEEEIAEVLKSFWQKRMCHGRWAGCVEDDSRCSFPQVPPPASGTALHWPASSAATQLQLPQRTYTSPHWLPAIPQGNYCFQLDQSHNPKWKKPQPPMANLIGCPVHLQVNCILLVESELPCTINIKSFPFGTRSAFFSEDSVHQTNHFQTHPLYCMQDIASKAEHGLLETRGDTECPRHLRESFFLSSTSTPHKRITSD